MSGRERPHGRAKYKNEGCKCDVCRKANTRYENLRRLRPTNLIDAEPAREHVKMLLNRGIGTRRVAALACMPRQNVQVLLYGKSPTKRMRPDGIARILAIDPDNLKPNGGARFDAVGARRRLQALARIGWSRKHLAERLGCSPSHVNNLFRANRLRYSTMTRIYRVFDELWDCPPPESTPLDRRLATFARRNAAARGWAPPMAWDDDAIDDPNAKPRGVPDVAVAS